MEKLLACQITVVMGVRNVEASKKAIYAAIPEEVRRNLVHFESLDTGDLKSVRAFAARIKAQYPKIDLLINNGTFENSTSIIPNNSLITENSLFFQLE